MSFDAAFWLPSRGGTLNAAPRRIELRALTVKQPWAACIAAGAKTVENRTWATKYRGSLAIHAGSASDRNAFTGIDIDSDLVMHAVTTAEHVSPDLLRGARFVAVAHLSGCHRAAGCCAPWGESGPDVWHWVLDRVQVLAQPVPARGWLGLWRVPEPAAEQVLAQIGAAA